MKNLRCCDLDKMARSDPRPPDAFLPALLLDVKMEEEALRTAKEIMAQVAEIEGEINLPRINPGQIRLRLIAGSIWQDRQKHNPDW